LTDEIKRESCRFWIWIWIWQLNSDVYVK
jgi:hypothetical protein